MRRRARVVPAGPAPIIATLGEDMEGALMCLVAFGIKLIGVREMSEGLGILLSSPQVWGP